MSLKSAKVMLHWLANFRKIPNFAGNEPHDSLLVVCPDSSSYSFFVIHDRRVTGGKSLLCSVEIGSNFSNKKIESSGGGSFSKMCCLRVNSSC